MSNAAPYLIALAGLVVTIHTGLLSWALIQIVHQGNRQTKIETAFTFYIESKIRGAALVLDTPNPTPMNIKELIHLRVQQRALTQEQRAILRDWLMRTAVESTSSDKITAVTEMLFGLDTMKILK